MTSVRFRKSTVLVMVGAAAAALTTSALVAAPAATATASAGAVPTLGAHSALVSDDATAYRAALHSPDWVATPSGLEHRSCVTKLPAGATLSGRAIRSASGHTTALPTCRYPRLVPPGSQRAGAPSAGPVPTTNGWMAASWWSAATWLSRLYSTFTVPNAPATAGATDFFFPSFEPAAGNAIIQPVLSFGGSAAGGGNYWYITSWYVFDNQSVYGANVSVNPGDQIEGTMTSSGCAGDGSNCQWTITTKDLSAGGQPASVLNTASAYSYTTAQGGVLESYGASQCSMLPSSGSIHFGDLQFAGPDGGAVGPTFGSFTPDTECGTGLSYSASTTDITWSPT